MPTNCNIVVCTLGNVIFNQDTKLDPIFSKHNLSEEALKQVTQYGYVPLACNKVKEVLGNVIYVIGSIRISTV